MMQRKGIGKRNRSKDQQAKHKKKKNLTEGSEAH